MFGEQRFHQLQLGFNLLKTNTSNVTRWRKSCLIRVRVCTHAHATSSTQVVAYLVLLVLEVHWRAVLLLHLAAVELVEVVLEVAQDFAQFLLLVAHARLLVEQLRSV